MTHTNSTIPVKVRQFGAKPITAGRRGRKMFLIANSTLEELQKRLKSKAPKPTEPPKPRPEQFTVKDINIPNYTAAMEIVRQIVKGNPCNDPEGNLSANWKLGKALRHVRSEAPYIGLYEIATDLKTKAGHPCRPLDIIRWMNLSVLLTKYEIHAAQTVGVTYRELKAILGVQLGSDTYLEVRRHLVETIKLRLAAVQQTTTTVDLLTK